MSKASDLSFGIISEKKNAQILSEFFETELIKDPKTFSTIDYSNKSKSIYVELKTRRINHNQYPTAIIGLNKVQFCKDDTKKYFFVYSYLDGIFYIKYDKDLFKDFSIQPMHVQYRSDVGRHEISDVVHIPVEKLIKLETGKTFNDKSLL
jgi:hypothetical protein